MIIFPSMDTTLCISVAQKPGKFGGIVHNAAYRALGLNFVYKPIQADEIHGVISAVRILGIRGCSVSMPFKQSVIPLLDQLDPTARCVGAVNTILNDGGCLKGFNTDVFGAYQVLAPYCKDSNVRIVVLGAGGVARAVLHALFEHNMHQITVCARRPEALEKIRLDVSVRTAPWEDREKIQAEWLINATSIGMAPNAMELPMASERIAEYQLVMDVVATHPISRLVEIARFLQVPSIDGYSMALRQAAAQFTIYTGQTAPISVMEAAASRIFPTTTSNQDGKG